MHVRPEELFKFVMIRGPRPSPSRARQWATVRYTAGTSGLHDRVMKSRKFATVDSLARDTAAGIPDLLLRPDIQTLLAVHEGSRKHLPDAPTIDALRESLADLVGVPLDKYAASDAFARSLAELWDAAHALALGGRCAATARTRVLDALRAAELVRLLATDPGPTDVAAVRHALDAPVSVPGDVIAKVRELADVAKDAATSPPASDPVTQAAPPETPGTSETSRVESLWRELVALDQARDELLALEPVWLASVASNPAPDKRDDKKGGARPAATPWAVAGSFYDKHLGVSRDGRRQPGARRPWLGPGHDVRQARRTPGRGRTSRGFRARLLGREPDSRPAARGVPRPRSRRPAPGRAETAGRAQAAHVVSDIGFQDDGIATSGGSTHLFGHILIGTTKLEIVDPASGYHPIAAVTGSLPVSVRSYSLDAIACNIHIQCVLEPEAFEQWQLETWSQIMESYERLLSEYQERLRAREFDTGAQIVGRHPLRNREIEREELKRQSLVMLTGSSVESTTPFVIATRRSCFSTGAVKSSHPGIADNGYDGGQFVSRPQPTERAHLALGIFRRRRSWFITTLLARGHQGVPTLVLSGHTHKNRIYRLRPDRSFENAEPRRDPPGDRTVFRPPGDPLLIVTTTNAFRDPLTGAEHLVHSPPYARTPGYRVIRTSPSQVWTEVRPLSVPSTRSERGSTSESRIH